MFSYSDGSVGIEHVVEFEDILSAQRQSEVAMRLKYLSEETITLLDRQRLRSSVPTMILPGLVERKLTIHYTKGRD